MNTILKKGKQILLSQQSSVISAASVIMLMVVASRILGLVRQRVLAHFFLPEELSLFFAAFRLPDLLFEVLVFGTFSSAFIPVFTKSLKKGDTLAWDIAGRVVNIGLVIFIPIAIIFSFNAEAIYSYVAPGFSVEEIQIIASIARVLFAAQAFFVVSYVLTGVLESLRIFLVPALAPVFYNLGIIAGTVLFTNSLGLFAPAVGVLLGAASHFFVQLPASVKLGFRFSNQVRPNDEVRKIGRLALPRVVDLSFQQVAKTVELYFASLISTASYTYFTFANTLQLLPVGLFGISIAKAALPTLSRIENDSAEFKKTLFSIFNQMIFLITPFATMLIIIRIPFVRLVYGTDIFGWEATVQTGMVLSSFGVGVVFQAAVALLSRAFYALHDTKTPVVASVISIFFNVFASFYFIKILKFEVWSLALSFSLSMILQTVLLFYLLVKKVNHTDWKKLFIPLSKIFAAASISGFVMYFLLKFFDRYTWVKRLSFLERIDAESIAFEKFVLDTRYTLNLLFLTVAVGFIGFIVYIFVSWILKSQELKVFVGLARKFTLKSTAFLSGASMPPKEQEPITSTDSDS